jgi:hypothetical protein
VVGSGGRRREKRRRWEMDGRWWMVDEVDERICPEINT